MTLRGTAVARVLSGCYLMMGVCLIEWRANSMKATIMSSGTWGGGEGGVGETGQGDKVET